MAFMHQLLLFVFISIRNDEIKITSFLGAFGESYAVAAILFIDYIVIELVLEKYLFLFAPLLNATLTDTPLQNEILNSKLN